MLSSFLTVITFVLFVMSPVIIPALISIFYALRPGGSNAPRAMAVQRNS